MKVIVQKDELQKKLSDIQNIVEKKNTMPILNHFLLSADAEGAYITATDLSTAFKEPIELKTVEPGKICIPARKLFEIVKEVDNDIAIESEDSQWVKVKSGKSNFRLACLSYEEFPVWPSMTKAEEIVLDSAQLLETIDKTIYAAGETDTRYVLNGLLFHLKPGGGLTVVGTDGHRLALFESTINHGHSEEKKMIISRKSVAELRRFLNEEGKPVDVAIGANHILFKTGDIQFLTRLIEGTYPNYEQVIPASNKKLLIVDRNLLTKSLKRVSIMSRERSNAVKVDIESSSSGGNMVISANNPDLGEAKDEISAKYDSSPLTIGLNAGYILNALSVMSSENVILKLEEALAPVLIMEEGREDYKCVVMPMRL